MQNEDISNWKKSSIAKQSLKTEKELLDSDTVIWETTHRWH